jgi:membrane-associated protein
LAQVAEEVEAPMALSPVVRKLAIWIASAVGVVLVVVFLWNQGGNLIRGESVGALTYVLVLALVFGDAVCPVLPGETTLNAASVLASHDRLILWLVIAAGALGAVLGDSVVYWVARSATGRLRHWLDRAAEGKSMAKAIDLLGRRGTIFLMFGRYSPGIRFALNVTLGGVVHMPYRKFLFWSTISGTVWSAFTCLSAYYVGSALEGYPLLSFILTGLLTSAIIASLIYLQAKWADRRIEQAEAGRADVEPTPVDS